MVDTTRILPFNEPGFLGRGYNRSIVGVTQGISQERLYSAYMQGVFPWFSEDDGEPVVWYSPDPRFCLRMEDLHVPRSVDRFLKHTPFSYTFDTDFSAVIHGCRAMNRPDQAGTWIGGKMVRAYEEFHRNGFAHSVEVWRDSCIVGGFYGVLMGSVFFGESMFTLESNSSKSAFVLFARAFARSGGKLIDSQVYTQNIARYGAKNISRDAFLRLEREYMGRPLEKNLKEEFERIAKMPAASERESGSLRPE